jgi:hypothetical protein
MPLSAFPMTNGTLANTSLDALVLSRLLLVEATVFASGVFLGKACVWQRGSIGDESVSPHHPEIEGVEPPSTH